MSKVNRPKNSELMNDFEKKHTPSISRFSSKIIIRVGCGVNHPMLPEHHITFIKLFLNGEHFDTKDLDYGDEPVVTFHLEKQLAVTDRLTAQANCNIHGVWESI
jgi:desulfoferrodoxin-like iron-binding protein